MAVARKPYAVTTAEIVDFLLGEIIGVVKVTSHYLDNQERNSRLAYCHDSLP
jgi:hypothetical protein